MKDLYIITGATGGMGYEASKHFITKGKVLLLDLDENLLNKVKKELGDDALALKFDITNESDLNNLIKVVKENGGFKYLFHFAGVSESMGNSELIYKINLIGSVKLLNKLYDYIKPGGVVINTSSITAHQTPFSNDVGEILSNPDDSDFLNKILPLTKTTTEAYGWSKKALLNFTEKEVSKWGLKDARILSISPGAIKTPMVEKEMEKNKDQIEQLINLTPVKRIGLPSDIVNLVDFLASSKASFITGVDIIIDGGVVSTFKYLKY